MLNRWVLGLIKPSAYVLTWIWPGVNANVLYHTKQSFMSIISTTTLTPLEPLCFRGLNHSAKVVGWAYRLNAGTHEFSFVITQSTCVQLLPRSPACSFQWETDSMGKQVNHFPQVSFPLPNSAQQLLHKYFHKYHSVFLLIYTITIWALFGELSWCDTVASFWTGSVWWSIRWNRGKCHKQQERGHTNLYERDNSDDHKLHWEATLQWPH